MTKKKQVSLRWAAQFGDLAQVKALLAAGADPNELDGTTTALCMACFHRKVPIVRVLLDAGASPSLSFPGGSAPLVEAVQSKSKRTRPTPAPPRRQASATAPAARPAGRAKPGSRARRR